MTNNVCLQPALQWDIPAAVPARSRPIAAKASVRPLEERDLEPLADLFMQRFRKARRNARSPCSRVRPCWSVTPFPA